MKYASKLGFTLAELLAVVIIVALLSGLGLGYYKRSVEDSRFAEGLSVASALVEAVNQSYFEQQLEDPESLTKQPKVQTLDINLAAKADCSSNKDYCIATPRFEVYIETDGSVRAYRGNASLYPYYIQINPSFAASKSNQISCVGADADGKTFCESMGYTDCKDNACLKCMKKTGSCWD